MVGLTSTPQRLYVCAVAIAIVVGSVVAISVIVATAIGFVVAIVAIGFVVATLILYCFPAAHCPLLRSPIFHGQKVS